MWLPEALDERSSCCWAWLRGHGCCAPPGSRHACGWAERRTKWTTCGRIRLSAERQGEAPERPAELDFLMEGSCTLDGWALPTCPAPTSRGWCVQREAQWSRMTSQLTSVSLARPPLADVQLPSLQEVALPRRGFRWSGCCSRCWRRSCCRRSDFSAPMAGRRADSLRGERLQLVALPVVAVGEEGVALPGEGLQCRRNRAK